jgi:hypothetical protein
LYRKAITNYPWRPQLRTVSADSVQDTDKHACIHSKQRRHPPLKRWMRPRMTTTPGARFSLHKKAITAAAVWGSRPSCKDTDVRQLVV